MREQPIPFKCRPLQHEADILFKSFPSSLRDAYFHLASSIVHLSASAMPHDCVHFLFAICIDRSLRFIVSFVSVFVPQPFTCCFTFTFFLTPPVFFAAFAAS